MHFAKNRFRPIALVLLCMAVLVTMKPFSFAQEAGSEQDIANLTTGSAAPALPDNLDSVPAKKLFGGFIRPAKLPAQAIGTYAKGCLSGAAALPVNGPAWQVMRLSRNRRWANPKLVSLVERLAVEAKANDGWNGLLVGDMSQPRGGPMKSGHASHQIGLDADVWLTPMPDHILSSKERETKAATVMTKSHTELDHSVWTESRARLIKRAASYPEVGRIFVHPPIKAELCRWSSRIGGDQSWLAKVRPIYGHNYHFHIRMKCPAGSTSCKDQWAPKPKDGTGCGEELAYWLGPIPWRPHPRDPNAPKLPPPPPLTLSGLPAQCRAVVTAR